MSSITPPETAAPANKARLAHSSADEEGRGVEGADVDDACCLCASSSSSSSDGEGEAVEGAAAMALHHSWGSRELSILLSIYTKKIGFTAACLPINPHPPNPAHVTYTLPITQAVLTAPQISKPRRSLVGVADISSGSRAYKH